MSHLLLTVCQLSTTTTTTNYNNNNIICFYVTHAQVSHSYLFVHRIIADDKTYTLGFLAVPTTPYLMAKSIQVNTSLTEVVLEEDSGCHTMEKDEFLYTVEGNSKLIILEI